MENNLTTKQATREPRLHEILPAVAYEMAAEEAPNLGRKQARVNVGTATTCRGTVFTVIYSFDLGRKGKEIPVAACGTGDYFSEALEAALADFEDKRPAWAALVP